MIIILQGTDFEKETVENTKLVLFNGMDRYIIDSTEKDGKIVFFADADTTKDWHSGKYNYQIFNLSSLLEEGIIKVKTNLLYSTEVDSFWRKALRQVEERLAGKAVDPANSVTIGDKAISYMSLSDLFRLRDFILSKIAEEESEERN